jgi:hypothetical protein
MRTTALSRFGFMEDQSPVTVWQPIGESNPYLIALRLSCACRYPFLRKSLLGDLGQGLQRHFEAQAFEPFG